MELKKNYAEVLIDGKIYTLGGVEEASYFQQVAAYVNQKLGELRRHPGFMKQKEDYQLVMLEINMADDYFKAREEADMLRRQTEATERDMYGIKHELINTQMRLESAQNRIGELEALLEQARSVRTAASLAQEPAPVSVQKQQETAARVQAVPAAAVNHPSEAALRLPVEKAAVSDEESEERARRAKEEEEKQKALAAAKVAADQLLKSRVMQMQDHLLSHGHQNKKK